MITGNLNNYKDLSREFLEYKDGGCIYYYWNAQKAYLTEVETQEMIIHTTVLIKSGTMLSLNEICCRLISTNEENIH